MDGFIFQTPRPLRDQELELVLKESLMGKASPWGVPVYVFEMQHAVTRQVVGRLTLRISLMENIVKYAGQVGYSVSEPFRGNHFAERACRLILPLAKAHGLNELWITCSPDNRPSRRTIERLGAQWVETVDVPNDYPLPEGVVRKKCRFRLDLI